MKVLTGVFLASLKFCAITVILSDLLSSQVNKIVPSRIVGVSYPRLAALAAVQGEVVLVATLTPEGDVREIAVESGSGLLWPAAKESLVRWRFAGCIEAQMPCKTKVKFVFVLSGYCETSTCPSDFLFDLPDVVHVRTRRVRAIVD